jgi:hypothetical protein
MKFTNADDINRYFKSISHCLTTAPEIIHMGDRLLDICVVLADLSFLKLLNFMTTDEME